MSPAERNADAVPLSEPLYVGQRYKTENERGSTRDSSGTTDIKSLALTVLHRDRQWDSSGTIAQETCPTADNGVGQTGDPYAERMRAALREINWQDYPAGMIPRPGEEAASLYAMLTEDLPNEIHQLWEAHAPLQQFEETLARLVSEHHRAVALYRAYLVSRGSENRTKS